MSIIYIYKYFMNSVVFLVSFAKVDMLQFFVSLHKNNLLLEINLYKFKFS